MTHFYQLDQIQHALKDVDPIQSIEEGFIAYSLGKVVVPPVGELLFKDPPGDVHIKYGYIIMMITMSSKLRPGFTQKVAIELPNNPA